MYSSVSSFILWGKFVWHWKTNFMEFFFHGKPSDLPQSEMLLCGIAKILVLFSIFFKEKQSYQTWDFKYCGRAFSAEKWSYKHALESSFPFLFSSFLWFSGFCLAHSRIFFMGFDCSFRKWPIHGIVVDSAIWMGVLFLWCLWMVGWE